MSNMSYCRFQNTLEDLKDCIFHFNDEDLSQEERHARARMVEEIVGFLEEVGVEVDAQQLGDMNVEYDLGMQL